MSALPITSIMEWTDGVETCVPTEHNRSPVSVDMNRIKESDRMANGRLREYYVADKRTWNVSWDMLPAPSDETVDLKGGGREIELFYQNHPGEFTLRIKHADSELDEEVTVVFASFDKTHVRRGAYDFWDVSVSLEEC